jgi:hypothetical protein
LPFQAHYQNIKDTNHRHRTQSDIQITDQLNNHRICVSFVIHNHQHNFLFDNVKGPTSFSAKKNRKPQIHTHTPFHTKESHLNEHDMRERKSYTETISCQPFTEQNEQTKAKATLFHTLIRRQKIDTKRCHIDNGHYSLAVADDHICQKEPQSQRQTHETHHQTENE